MCFAYLRDVPPDEDPCISGSYFSRSRWFTRGWTLQELIAPSVVVFLANNWQNIGTKSRLQRVLSKITGVPVNFLLGDDLENASVAQRMSWASKQSLIFLNPFSFSSKHDHLGYLHRRLLSLPMYVKVSRTVGRFAR